MNQRLLPKLALVAFLLLLGPGCFTTLTWYGKGALLFTVPSHPHTVSKSKSVKYDVRSVIARGATLDVTVRYEDGTARRFVYTTNEGSGSLRPVRDHALDVDTEPLEGLRLSFHRRPGGLQVVTNDDPVRVYELEVPTRSDWGLNSSFVFALFATPIAVALDLALLPFELLFVVAAFR